MKQWLSRMKLAHKMVLGFLGLIALPFTLLSVFSFASVASHYEHQLAQDGQYMLNMVVSDVNEKMDHVEMLMQVLSCNQNLIAFLSHDYNGAVSHEEYTQTVMPLLQGASNAVSPPLERVYLLTKNTTIPEGYSAVYHYDSIPKSIPTELLENGREATWYHAEIDGKDVLYYLCPIVSSVYKNQGYLLAKMRVDELFPEFGMPQQNGVALFLLDEENLPKLSNVTLNSDFRFPQTAGSQESVRYFSTEIQRVSLRVGVALPVSEHGYLQQSSLLILIFVGFLSLLFLSLFFSMIRSINSRLQRYGDEMERIAESGFNGELAVERQDEIGVIGNQFNRVLGRMRVLMQENIQKETAYKDAQLKALLLQINPHFTDSNLNHTGIYLYSKGKIMIHLTFDYKTDEKCTTPGQYLKYHRTFQGLSTRELAEKVGIVPATLVLYENDRHPIKHSTAVALANALGIDRNRLLDKYTAFVDYPYSSLLKKVRQDLSLTQIQMAELIGIGQTSYSGWEREIRVPRRKEYDKILAALEKLRVNVDTYLCQSASI